MSRRKKTRTDGGFVMVSRQMTRSAAFRSLSPRAMALLVGLMDRYDGKDNRVPMSLREAMVWLHSGSDKASAAFKELRKKGFVRCHELGGFARKVRHASVWTLTMFGRGGQKATLDFLDWRPPADTQTPEHGTQGRCNTAPEASAMDPPIAPEAGAVRPDNGTQGRCNTAPEASALIECTIESRAPKAAQTPRPRARANGGAGRFSLPDAIKAGRVHRGWSQRDLAHHAQTHQPIVSKIERGDLGRIGAATIERVALAVGIGPRERITEHIRSITNGRTGP